MKVVSFSMSRTVDDLTTDRDWKGYAINLFLTCFHTQVFFTISLHPVIHLDESAFFDSMLFLVADTQLFKRLCPSVHRSVRPSARVEKWVNAHIRPCPPVCNWWQCIRPCFFFLTFFLFSLSSFFLLSITILVNNWHFFRYLFIRNIFVYSQHICMF